MLIRWYAGAAEAAGVTEEEATLAGGLTIAETLAAHRPGAARVLGRCSFLVDGARREAGDPWPESARTLDVLPPFVGG